MFTTLANHNVILLGSSMRVPIEIHFSLSNFRIQWNLIRNSRRHKFLVLLKGSAAVVSFRNGALGFDSIAANRSPSIHKNLC